MAITSPLARQHQRAAIHQVLPCALLCLVATLLSTTPTWAGFNINVTKVSDLSFGKLVPGGSVAYVALSPGGVRTPTGSVTLFQQGGGGGSAASFSVVVSGGKQNSVCTVVPPVNSFVYLTGAGADMVVNNFNASTLSVNLDGKGDASATVDVGGTLTIGGAQAPGSYSSSFTLSVTCP